MELLYLVDELDNVIGPVERRDAHRDGKLHRSGTVFLRRSDGRVLIQHRSRSKETFPGRPDSSAAFHVTYGESYESAAARELLEETGISAPMAYAGKFVHRDPPENEVVAVYCCESDEEVRVDPAESEGFEFLSVSEVDALVTSSRPTPWLRDGWPVAKKALGKTYLGRK
ncbi:MAG: NUDIX domain-containing protein [Nitrososphaerota archaeon]|nr:NUDIX domain-containing protein [Nitrososphaerota archaeon]